MGWQDLVAVATGNENLILFPPSDYKGKPYKDYITPVQKANSNMGNNKRNNAGARVGVPVGPVMGHLRGTMARATRRMNQSYERMGQSLGTKDMVRGPHYRNKIGRTKHIDVAGQLNQLVDDTKVFKQQFKLKIGSADGVRQWAQIVCRYRAAPGKNDNSTLSVHGATLDPNTISEVKSPIDYYSVATYNSKNNTEKYRYGCPPMVEGRFEGSGQNLYLTGTYHSDDASYGNGPLGSKAIMQNNLFFLNMPLTYLEQDMYNMGMGPGIRKFTRNMYQTDSEIGLTVMMDANGDVITQGAQLNPNITTQGEVMTVNTTLGDYRGRMTQMKPVTHPNFHETIFEMKNAPVNYDLIASPHVGLNMKYDFRWGWGINMLDYNLIDSDMDGDKVSPSDPQWLKTNNSDVTIATIAHGEASFTFNNLGDTQAYVSTLVVVQKHVDEHYWSMPTALTDTYLKCAQEFIQSGEWSITNNITQGALANANSQQSEGEIPDPYMYISHPTIKPFGKVPAKFLEDFNKHYTIKSQTTMKLGIGERQSCKIDLGGLQYSTNQIAMNKELTDRSKPEAAEFYHPTSTATGAMANLSTAVKANFPFCCQQGTTHFLFGVQGFNTPYVKKTKLHNGVIIDAPDGTPDVKTCAGRWATSALVDISGVYKEVIKPLTTGKSNPKPIQRCLTNLPSTGDYTQATTLYPVATAMPRIRTTPDGAMEMNSSL